MPDYFEAGIMQGLGGNSTGISPLFYGSDAISSGVVASQEYGVDVSNWMNIAVPQQQMKSDFTVGFGPENSVVSQSNTPAGSQTGSPSSQSKSISRFTMFGTGSGNVPSALGSLPIVGPAVELAAEVFPGMMPDFVTVGGGGPIPFLSNFPILEKYSSWSIQLSLDSYGDLYFGLGGTLGIAKPEYSFNAAAGWLNQMTIPTQEQSSNFLAGIGYTVSIGVTGPYAAEQFASGMSATVVGIGTPQIGVAKAYSVEIDDTIFNWRNNL
jgi:hypothetical protein